MDDFYRHLIGVFCTTVLELIALAGVVWVLWLAFFWKPWGKTEEEIQLAVRILVGFVTLCLLIVGSSWGVK